MRDWSESAFNIDLRTQKPAVRHEARSVSRVEPLDRLEEAEARLVDQVLEGDAAAPKFHGNPDDERDVTSQELVGGSGLPAKGALDERVLIVAGQRGL